MEGVLDMKKHQPFWNKKEPNGHGRDVDNHTILDEQATGTEALTYAFCLHVHNHENIQTWYFHVEKPNSIHLPIV